MDIRIAALLKGADGLKGIVIILKNGYLMRVRSLFQRALRPRRLAESHHEGHEEHQDGIRHPFQSRAWLYHQGSLISRLAVAGIGLRAD